VVGNNFVYLVSMVLNFLRFWESKLFKPEILQTVAVLRTLMWDREL